MRVVVTGGRSPATLELCRAMWRQGHAVVLAEHIGWHLSRGSRAVERFVRLPAPAQDPAAFIDALEALLQRERADFYVPTCEEILYVAAARDRLAATCPLLCPPLEQLVRLHDKGRFVEVVREHGLRAPASLRVDSVGGLQDALESAWRERRRVVLKPVFSRFAARVVIDPRQASEVAAVDPSPADPWLVQDFVEGLPLCTYGLARDGVLVAHSAYPTRYTLGLGASVHFEADHDPALRAWVAQFVAAERFTGQIAFDLIRDAAGELWAIECNPRITSGLHLLAHAPGLIATFLNASTTPVDARGARPAMLGTSMLLALPQASRGEPGLRTWWRDYRAARDVAVDWRDPLPMLVSRFVWMVGVILRARRLGVTPQEAASIDFEWNGPPQAPTATSDVVGGRTEGERQ
jgi:predicted ATP-grasp superfamily ATP-dependent carboligase